MSVSLNVPHPHLVNKSLFFLGLGILILTMGYGFISHRRSEKLMNLEQALWVTDWELETLYAPGSTTQRAITEQLHLGALNCSEYKVSDFILYRMGGTAVSNPREGILLYNFNPEYPEMMNLLRAGNDKTQQR